MNEVEKDRESFYAFEKHVSIQKSRYRTNKSAKTTFRFRIQTLLSLKAIAKRPHVTQDPNIAKMRENLYTTLEKMLTLC